MINLFVFIFTVFTIVSCTDKPRGIPFSKLSFYQPNTPFKCLDGSGVISWLKVNDDYCDCRDATDEPGTSACSNGVFFCDNKGHRPEYVLSSRVNDGICDCCDGQDEYSGIINCTNTCWEIGAAAREETQRLREASEKGHKIYLEYVKEFEVSVAEKKSRLESINEQFKILSEEKLSAERQKTDAESIETEAKRVYEENWKKIQSETQVKLDQEKITKAFQELDINSDNKVSIEELQSHQEFDIDQSGDVSFEEAKEYLSDHESVDETVFVDTVWPNIKQIFKFKEHLEHDQSAAELDGSIPEPVELGGEDDKSTGAEDHAKPSTEDTPKMEYDEETQKLISAASESRQRFSEIQERHTKLEGEKRDIENLLNIDYGPDSAFYKLAEDSACYELADREYMYRLCPFKKTSQLSKDGSGPETELGRWGHWGDVQQHQQQYSSQIYDNGLSCWNGPNRQTRVQISCGVENRLTEASEPSRCEYLFKFETPSACHKPADQIGAEHDEL